MPALMTAMLTRTAPQIIVLLIPSPVEGTLDPAFVASEAGADVGAGVGVAVAAAVVVTTAAAEGTAATPQHDDDQKDDPDPAAAVGRAKHMLVPFPAPEISAPRLRGNRRAGVGGLTGSSRSFRPILCIRSGECDNGKEE